MYLDDGKPSGYVLGIGKRQAVLIDRNGEDKCWPANYIAIQGSTFPGAQGQGHMPLDFAVGP